MRATGSSEVEGLPISASPLELTWYSDVPSNVNGSDAQNELPVVDGTVVFESLRPIHTSGGFCDVFVGRHEHYGRVALKQPRIADMWTLRDKQVCLFLHLLSA
jgi:hypothetical protein